MPEKMHESDTSGMTQNYLYTSLDDSESDESIFDDEPFCNDTDDQSKKFDNELNRSAYLEDNHYYPPRSKSDSENLQYKPMLSKDQSFKKIS